MKVVKVYGALRKKLGQCRFQFDVDTPAQAFKALCVNFPGLDKWLLDSEKEGVSYRVTIGKEKLEEHNFVLAGCPYSEQEVLSITPILAGAGGSGAQIGIGVGLIALSFLLPGAGLFGTTSIFGQVAAGSQLAVPLVGAIGTAGGAFATALGTAFSLVGASLVLGGIAQAISPSPINSTAAVNSFERGRDAAKFESFSFSGIVNTAKQGLPVPIAYGRVFVGSAVLSSGLDVDQTQ
jgi:predicted phage tail protein